MTWASADSLSHDEQLRRVGHLQLILTDVIAQLPASSVDVERQHANTQVDVSHGKSVPKRPTNIQADSYTCAVTLVHVVLIGVKLRADTKSLQFLAISFTVLEHYSNTVTSTILLY